jgi:hypothetical protein
VIQIEQGKSMGLGLTVDRDNDVVLVLTIFVNEELGYAVPIMPDVARHIGRSLRDMSREADKLQDELDDLDPEEIQDRLVTIQNRYLTDPAPPDETV